MVLSPVQYLQCNVSQKWKQLAKHNCINDYTGIHRYYTTRTSCCNHRVVTMVADKLERQWLWQVALVLKTNCIRQPKRKLASSSYNHNTLTILRTSVRGVITNSLQSYSKELIMLLNGSRWFPHVCSEGWLLYCGCKMNWAGTYTQVFTNIDCYTQVGIHEYSQVYKVYTSIHEYTRYAWVYTSTNEYTWVYTSIHS